MSFLERLFSGSEINRLTEENVLLRKENEEKADRIKELEILVLKHKLSFQTLQSLISRALSGETLLILDDSLEEDFSNNELSSESTEKWLVKEGNIPLFLEKIFKLKKFCKIKKKFII